MTLDDDSCYRAIASRDRRFEGRFVVAVKTTQVYCRPGCPAPLPLRRNVRFYLCPAAAEEAGFRPCMRCRPESAPGTPAWLGSSATVVRALRLIEDGALDQGGVGTLASRLGVGARHLRRLFAEHLGASPLAVASTRRVHFARRLLDETCLPMIEVARSAGFSSVRRFNDAILTTFRKPPRELRKGVSAGSGAMSKKSETARAGGVVKESDEALSLRVPCFLPYEFAPITRYLGARAFAGVEVAEPARYRRVLADDAWVEVVPAERGLRLTVHGRPALVPLVARVGRVFDCAVDPAAVAEHLRRDPHLAPLVDARPAVRVPGAWDAFELAVRAVLGQQVSVKGATTLAARLVGAFGEPLRVPYGEGLTHRFPSPEELRRADVAKVGLTRARAATLLALAEAAIAGELRATAEPLDALVARLVAIPGVGPWTAHYVAMRAFGEPDAFPAGDLVLRRSYARGGAPVTAKALERAAEAWRPWRAYAAMHLWLRA